MYLFGLSILLSAALVFLIEPMASKMVLPLLGGSPAVWNTCIMFYQACLLFGYLYAHLATAWLGVRKQAILHLCLLFLPLYFLPIALPEGRIHLSSEYPIAGLLLLLAITIGCPFTAVAATSPLLQKWFSQTSSKQARDPYFLYGASNVGSLLGLLSYPLLVERFFSIRAQGLFWSGGFIVLGLLQAGCVLALFKHPVSEGSPPRPEAPKPRAAGRLRGVSIKRRLHWLALSAVPASWMLGVTTMITTDIAPVPFLWVLPLAVYLLSFVLVFSRGWKVSHRWTGRFFFVALFVFFLVHLWPVSWQMKMVLQLALLFTGGVACHSRLEADRPGTGQLTEFYFWLSLGGVLGGAFNALLAPVLFSVVLELPLAVIAACFLCYPGKPANQKKSGLPDFLLWAAACLLWLTVLAGYVNATLVDSLVLIERNFFGVYRVADDGEMMILTHGTVDHGIQAKDPVNMCVPLSFYHPVGPLGDIFRSLSRAKYEKSVGVIGLGAGTVFSYSHPGQKYDFYELDPEVARIATNPRFFRYLSHCGKGQYRIITGDGRLKIAEAPDGAYGLILLDAFSSDAIPVHLLTREALHIYLSKLDTHGLLAYHISNNYVDLEPVMATLAKDAGLVAVSRLHDHLTSGQISRGILASQYVVFARGRKDLRGLDHLRGWYELRARDGVRPWTDQYSNILQFIK